MRTPPPYPVSRPRRLRRDAFTRALVRENRLAAEEKKPRHEAGAGKPYRCHHGKAPAQGGKAGDKSLTAIIHQLL